MQGAHVDVTSLRVRDAGGRSTWDPMRIVEKKVDEVG